MPLDQLAGKTLLVTGATGFIGSHLVHHLLRVPDAHLVLLSRQPSPAHLDPCITWIKADLRDLARDTWHSAGIGAIHVVFHFGGFTPKSATQANQVDRVCEDNLLGTGRLLAALPCVQRIVFASTLDVYAPCMCDSPLTESSPVIPTGLYGASKLFCEHLVRDFARTSGCGLAILRYGHIFGPGEEAYEKLIPQTVRRLLRRVSPELHGDGSTLRDYLYVEDAVEAAVRAAASDVAELGPVNIVRGESQPIRAVVDILAALTGFHGAIRYLADKPNGPSLRFDSKQMRELLGEWPLVPLEEGLRREIDHVRSGGACSLVAGG